VNILAIGIHPDDIELGCGGTVALASGQGHDVTLLDLADGAASSNGTVEERAAEAAAAGTILGAGRRINLGFADAGIQSQNLQQLAAVVAAIRDTQPVVVLAPSADDPHPDHASGGSLIERACYMAGVHGYERSHPAWRPKHLLIYPGRVDVDPDLVVDVTGVFDTKMSAIRAHVTQFEPGEGRKPTPLNSPDFLSTVEARARLNGASIGVRFGEAFLSANPMAVTELGAVFKP
jgi:bacillithiol biosynthesis deacetylase BshB1